MYKKIHHEFHKHYSHYHTAGAFLVGTFLVKLLLGKLFFTLIGLIGGIWYVHDAKDSFATNCIYNGITYNAGEGYCFNETQGMYCNGANFQAFDCVSNYCTVLGDNTLQCNATPSCVPSSCTTPQIANDSDGDGCPDDGCSECGNNIEESWNEFCDGGANCTSCQCDSGYEPDPNGNGCLPLGPICGNNIEESGEFCDGGANCTSCQCDSGYEPDPNGNGCVAPLVTNTLLDYSSSIFTCEANNFDALIFTLSLNDYCGEQSYRSYDTGFISNGNHNFLPTDSNGGTTIAQTIENALGNTISYRCTANLNTLIHDGPCQTTVVDCNGDLFDSFSNPGYVGSGDACTTGGQSGIFNEMCVCNISLPNISISDAGTNEGDVLTYTISLDMPAQQQVTFDIVVDQGGSDAIPGLDFPNTPLSWPIIFDVGEDVFELSIPTFVDNLYEGNLFEILRLHIINLQGANIQDDEGIGQIYDIDTIPLITIGSTTSTEGDVIHFPFTLSNGSIYEIRARLSTFIGTANSGDYVVLSGETIVILPGITSGVVSVNTIDDNTFENNEYFFLQFGSPPFVVGYDAANPGSYGTGIIIDNDFINCGNGTIEGTEQCDDGNTSNTDSCTNVCLLPSCGDSYIQGGESCDDGNMNNNDGCSTSCLVEICGDGVLQSGEGCDDGNTTNGDGCNASCVLESCGNGTIEGTEQCDDGNTSNTDGCTNVCLLPSCGDSYIQGGESCDDGNMNNNDGCSTSCLVEICGDGVLQSGEGCDDGNTTNGDGCSASCVLESCGNGTIEGMEQCDDGNTSNTDSCTNVCLLPSCGDSYIQGGESCDDGNMNNNDGCSTSCLVEICGDGVLQSGEGCDDGNTTNGDGCSASCVLESCGNGTIEGMEQCDDGNTSNTDSCTNVCLLPSCGDSYIQGGESCDDGNMNNNDGCSTSCLVEICGDGVLQSGEGCDDGNTTNGDGCNASCVLESCGNGTIEGTEQCDDGNTSNTDGCTNVCLLPSCGDSYIQGGESCDDGNMNNNDGCSTSCLVEICGDGVLQSGEGCDDGNTTNGDGCNASCVLESCGNGTIEGTEQCDDGNTSNTDGCTNVCLLPSCGDSYVQFGEQCDDGNNSNNDGCSISCVLENYNFGGGGGGGAGSTSSSTTSSSTTSSSTTSSSTTSSSTTSSSTTSSSTTSSAAFIFPSESNLIHNPGVVTDTTSQQIQAKPTIIQAVETQKVEAIIEKSQNLQQTPDTKTSLISDIVGVKKEESTTTIDLNALRTIFMCQQYDYNQKSLRECIDNLPVGDCNVMRIQGDVVSLDSEKILDCIPEARTFEDNQEDFVPGALYIENYDTEIDKKIVFLQQFIPGLHVWGHNIFTPYLPGFARIEFDPSISKRDLYGIMKYLGISKEELLPSNPSPIPIFKTAKIIGLEGNEKEFSQFLEDKMKQSSIRQYELSGNMDQPIFTTQTIQESIQKRMHTTSSTQMREENNFTNFLKEKKQKSIVRQSYNDPLVDDQNYLQTIRYPEALQICDKEASRKIDIAIIDSAFDVHHEDFGSNVVYTKDVANNDSIVMTPIGQEYDTERAHGTYSLGIIGAVSDNQKGIMSLVDKYASISLYKAAADQGRGQDIGYGIESLIAAAKSKPDIISLSWGAYIKDKKSLSYLEKVIAKILNQGTVIVASAGNYNRDDLFYPAAIEGVIAVGAIDSSSQKATFSNYGSRVDVAAPGVEVMTTAPNNNYKKINGTSESAPVVTAALAWIMSKGGTWYDIATTLSPLTTLDVGRGSINLEGACNSLKQSLENVEKEHASSTPIIENETPLFEIQFAKGKTLPIQLIFLCIFMILLTVGAWKLVMYREHHWVEKNPE